QYFTTVAAPPDDKPPQSRRNISHCRGCPSRGCSLRAKTQHRKHLRKVHKTFCLFALIGSQNLTSILAVEKLLQTFVNPRGQFELFQVGREIEFDQNSHYISLTTLRRCFNL